MSRNRSSLSGLPTKITRRFTTLEGFREIGDLYVAGSNVRVFSVQNQFDSELYEDDRTTRSSFSLPSQRRSDIVLGLEENKRNPDDNEAVTTPQDTKPLPEAPYHVFSNKERWVVVVLIGSAGLFSGLSSNIYFPALDAIAQVCLSCISPLLWGTLSDTIGRRQIYIYSFLVYILANIGLSFSPTFTVLFIFRGLQAAGSASTVSIGNGVIQDIIPPAERGGFISFYQAIRNLSIAVGPVLGGILNNFFGFRSIFIFLLILSTLTLVAILLFLPETLRSIAGDGSVRLHGIHRPFIRRRTKESLYDDPSTADVAHNRPNVTARTFVEPLLLLKEKDILLSLLFGGTVYAVWSMVTASTTGIFKRSFHLSNLLLGLSFIPNGLGTIVGSTIVGNLMNQSYVQAEAAYKERRGLAPTFVLSKKAIPLDFPIEHARLQHIGWITVAFILSTAAYGFSVAFDNLTSRPGWIALPLVLQFLIAATSNAIFAINQTMVSDLCPGRGASSTAINNLVRCSLGAIGVAFVEKMIENLSVAGAFLGLSLITLGTVPMVVIQWYWGRDWRRERGERGARDKM
ncbi:MFS general substrate transporter [Aaosphaeria arxii CBS 175.79]|uniref:MFS general substrate transporter n=1 Tax=Aaosphaeria arxii CBS 175.79 TaxID=1450172 RepID=A0A6A5XAY4_9PLEO|nr:MFS general substrate transporter [Aaosphaeria arxii CBS 175.79]KAF2010006.1 MFS general substrate transporter [Aaosphaeria arxii CBS 175.79]